MTQSVNLFECKRKSNQLTHTFAVQKYTISHSVTFAAVEFSGIFSGSWHFDACTLCCLQHLEQMWRTLSKRHQNVSTLTETELELGTKQNIIPLFFIAMCSNKAIAMCKRTKQWIHYIYNFSWEEMHIGTRNYPFKKLRNPNIHWTIKDVIKAHILSRKCCHNSFFFLCFITISMLLFVFMPIATFLYFRLYQRKLQDGDEQERKRENEQFFLFMLKN